MYKNKWNHIRPFDNYLVRIKKINRNYIYLQWIGTHRHNSGHKHIKYISLIPRFNDKLLDKFTSIMSNASYRRIKGEVLRQFAYSGIQLQYINDIYEIHPQHIYKMSIKQTYSIKQNYAILIIDIIDVNTLKKIETRMSLKPNELEQFKFNLHTNEVFSNTFRTVYRYIVDGNFLIDNLVTFGLNEEDEVKENE
jgi:hypothetical protein